MNQARKIETLGKKLKTEQRYLKNFDSKYTSKCTNVVMKKSKEPYVPQLVLSIIQIWKYSVERQPWPISNAGTS